MINKGVIIDGQVYEFETSIKGSPVCYKCPFEDKCDNLKENEVAPCDLFPIKEDDTCTLNPYFVKVEEDDIKNKLRGIVSDWICDNMSHVVDDGDDTYGNTWMEYTGEKNDDNLPSKMTDDLVDYIMKHYKDDLYECG